MARTPVAVAVHGLHQRSDDAARDLILEGHLIDMLQAFHAHLRSLGVALHHARDPEVSQSLYLRNPDGLLIEVHVDANPAVWAARPEAVATVRPLRVDWLGGSGPRGTH